MRFPYIISIWCVSLTAAHSLLNLHGLGDQLVQLLPDSEMKHSYWLILRVTGDQKTAWKNSKQTPKLKIIS